MVALLETLKRVHPQSTLIGFLGGPSGLLENRSRPLSQEELALYRNMGGFDLLGSGRTKIEKETQFAQALETVKSHDLDGLVVIGGDDSNTNAAFLAEFFLRAQCKTCVIGVPKTIDGDLKGGKIELSFGFDSATKVYSSLIGNLCRDALSARKYTHFVKLMGRSASHVALECALQTAPNVALIGEEVQSKGLTLKQLMDSLAASLQKRAERGRPYGVVLIPEGIIEFIPEIKTLLQELSLNRLSRASAAVLEQFPEAMRLQLQKERDPHGNVQLSQIATEQLLIEGVAKRLKGVPFHPLAHFFGYEGRCCYPSNFDVAYCLGLGTVAAALIHLGCSGVMATLGNLAAPPEEWVASGEPLRNLFHMEERQGEHKSVIAKALVDLHDRPFLYFKERREEWLLEDRYLFPGPMQFDAPLEPPLSLSLSNQAIETSSVYFLN